MQQRGHSVADAEAEMDMKAGTLLRFLNEQLLGPGRANCSKIAAYTGMPGDEVWRMTRRDAEQLRRNRAEVLERQGCDIVTGGGDVATWWGIIPAEPRVERAVNSCRCCSAATACRRAVAAGTPMPCERILESEILAPHERHPRVEVDFYGVPV
jgi:hypothetical protein